MSTRKIWVRRGGASATLVTINEADLVDDVRELILRKYANSLGRQFDAPDLTLRITPREQMRQSRTLGPEEPMCRVLDAYFPGSQTVDEALVIEIPLRRSTPRASPRTGPPHAPQLTSVLYDDTQPPETGTDYFGPGAIAHLPIPLPAATVGATNAVTSPHSIAVLTNGQIPQIPSPGGSRSRPYRDRPERPRLGRQHTSSPTILGVVTGPQAAALAAAANVVNPPPPQAKVERSRTHSNASSDHSVAGAPANPPPAPPLPTPPAPETTAATIQRVATPPPRVSSPRPASSRPKKKKTVDHPPAPSSSIVTAVPPINVLIVEDNIINLRLLEQFVKRLKVRWQTAMNGQEAVTKWRAGGFHLVLMDIQLPVMNGLEATKEIRRLERVNSIGVMSSSQSKGAGNGSNDSNEPSEEDRLENRELFKSPVIIVALTASSLQSDRHHALAAGCNDFLTKPLIFAWFQRKVMEWGCMQALIDFDGWRKWKDFSQKADETDPTKKTAAKAKTKKNRLSTAYQTGEGSVGSPGTERYAPGNVAARREMLGDGGGLV
ncbi:hypothetical protein GQ53DRAFT_786319 [Thozetella sp. PMI_491]|nr:hypothetical protein GQ53DRAFT_786319 [Thozetella sp. PMI_491]